MNKYVVIYERSATGWGAYVPDLPGLGVVGSTLEETRQLIRDGIGFHIEDLRSGGNQVPPPSTLFEEVEVNVYG
jgi:predicted RNase H-like HicB family nuclease